jgi:serine/threonine-protein kinase HipA
MVDALAVWLYGAHVATIEQRRGRMRLAYTDDAFARWAPGTPLLSVSLPLSRAPYPHGLARAFVDGLLPEGEPRQIIATELRLTRDDSFGLIAALGRDCAGAVVIQDVAAPAPPPATARTAEPLSDEEVAGLIANLRSAPLGVDRHTRVSLAGIQEKLLLTRMPDGRWGRPVDGTPSTHILKPQTERFPGIVENEMFCMRVATHAGLDAAAVELREIGDRSVLVVERYDRITQDNGGIERVHQEDLCQATGTPPEKKYEQDGGPSLREMARIIESVAPPASLDALAERVAFHAAIGNADAHAKNYSLLHGRSGSLQLAPCYDVVCTVTYRVEHLAMRIDGVSRLSRITRARVVNEIASWGMPPERAHDAVARILGRLPSSVDAAQSEVPQVGQDVVAAIRRQVAQLETGQDGW